jgi:hypothetical protein
LLIIFLTFFTCIHKSQYRIRLEEKQLRFDYSFTERQLLKYIRIAGKEKESMTRQISTLPKGIWR